jgi:hypothetical protein
MRAARSHSRDRVGSFVNSSDAIEGFNPMLAIRGSVQSQIISTECTDSLRTPRMPHGVSRLGWSARSFTPHW